MNSNYMKNIAATVMCCASTVCGATNITENDLKGMSSKELDAVLAETLARTAERSSQYQGLSANVYEYCRNGDVELLRNYLENGGNPNGNNPTDVPYPLLLAALIADQYECADMLIEHGADVNAPSRIANIATELRLIMLNAEAMYFCGKAGYERLEKAKRRVDYMMARGATVDEVLVSEAIMKASEKLLAYSKSEYGDSVINAKCGQKYIQLPSMKIDLLNCSETSLEWFRQQCGNTNIIIAATVLPGGREAAEKLANICYSNKIRMFIVKQLPPLSHDSNAEKSDANSRDTQIE